MLLTFDLASAVEWATVVGTFVAAAGVLVAVIAMTFQVRQAGFAATAENLWRFDDEWRGSDYRTIRLAAAKALKAGTDAPEIFDILGFFEMLGLLARRGGIDEEVVRNDFTYWARNYWYACESIIKKDRQDHNDDSLWLEYQGLVDRLDHPKGLLWVRVYTGTPKPSAQNLQDFFDNEMKVKP
jgi:hypothetical protein